MKAGVFGLLVPRFQLLVRNGGIWGRVLGESKRWGGCVCPFSLLHTRRVFIRCLATTLEILIPTHADDPDHGQWGHFDLPKWWARIKKVEFFSNLFGWKKRNIGPFGKSLI